MGKIVCFTGKRPQNMPFKFDEYHPRCIALKEKMYNEIEKLISIGCSHFITGMALGVDIWAAEAVLYFKRRGMPVLLEAAIPCKGQEKRPAGLILRKQCPVSKNVGANLFRAISTTNEPSANFSALSWDWRKK